MKHEVTYEQKREDGGILQEKGFAALGIQSDTFVAQRNIFGRGVGKAFQQIAHQNQ